MFTTIKCHLSLAVEDNDGVSWLNEIEVKETNDGNIMNNTCDYKLN